ncbi:hypothetical protein DPI70_24840 [Escherichia coli]|nr:hypothetical protein [Escherichia coli]
MPETSSRDGHKKPLAEILIPFVFPVLQKSLIFQLILKINILRHSRRFFKCAYKALLPAAP